MARRVMTEERHREIERLLRLGLSVREISRTLKCTRRTIRRIRDGTFVPPGERVEVRPFWSAQMDWDGVLKEVLQGHALKFIWEERVRDEVSYINFWKQFHRRFPQYKQATVVHRFFSPGERCEVDYAGKTVPWYDPKTGRLHEAVIFVGVLGCSQLIFACAKEDAKSPRFLDCHAKMYAAFGGVPQVTVPDCLKQGVSKCHLYDPDLNPSYADLAKHYGTAIVPARPRHPKDKALVENAVGILWRTFRFCTRHQRFTSLDQINEALSSVVDRINRRVHSQFKISRYERWQQVERAKLASLPSSSYEYVEWKEAKLHPDSHVQIHKCFYSAPHIHRGRTLKVKISEHSVEIFLGLERLALHRRCRCQNGTFMTNWEHLPENAKAYYEATPAKLRSQAKYLSEPLYQLIDDLFKENALGHIRRAQGFIREARKVIDRLGLTNGQAMIQQAVATMRAFNKVRVPFFKELITKQQVAAYEPDRSIQRQNPTMLRHVQPKSTGEDYGNHTSEKSVSGPKTGRHVTLH